MLFDETLAKALIDKYVLVGLSYVDSQGHCKAQQQLHGTIISATEKEGIKLRLAGSRQGEVWTMPPDMSAITAADVGEYTLKSTGEVVSNPDYLCTWEIHLVEE